MARTIVVIDDYELTLYTIFEWLRELDCEPIGEKNGHSGLSRIVLEGKQNPVSGVLLLYMPVNSGVFVLQELRKTNPGLPVIAMADADKRDDVWEAMRQGAGIPSHSVTSSVRWATS